MDEPQFYRDSDSPEISNHPQSSRNVLSSLISSVISSVNPQSQMSTIREDHKPIPDIIFRPTARGGQEFRVERFLGSGAFADVYEISKVVDPSVKYAVKIFQKDRLTERTIKYINSEIDIHKTLKHKGIIRYYTSFEDCDFIYIILGLCTHHTLKELLIHRQFLSEPEVCYFAVQILLTIAYLHQNQIIHRDLKPGNIFLCDGLRTKLGDFGLSYQLEPEEKLYITAGTPNYMAPEIINKVGYGFPADMWALGCIIYMLLNGSPPFHDRTTSAVFQNIRRGNYSWKRPHISNTAKDLVHSLLQLNPSARPTPLKCLEHPFFNKRIPRYLPLETFTEQQEKFVYIKGDQFDFYADINDI